MAWSSDRQRRATALRFVQSVVPAVDSNDGVGVVVANFSMPVDHPLVQGHYPGCPIVPGTCLMEAALQAIEVAVAPSPGKSIELLRIEGLQFLHVASPGQTIELRLSPDRKPDAAGAGPRSWRASFSVAGRQIARSSLTVGPMESGLEYGKEELSVTHLWNPLRPLDIASRLPHRAPMLLIDSAWVAPTGDGLVASRAVTLADLCYGAMTTSPDPREFNYPALLAAESFAQAAGLLLGVGDESGLALLGGAQRIEFFGASRPGESLRHEVKLRRRFGSAAQVSGSTFSNGTLIARTHDLLIAVKQPQSSPYTELHPSSASTLSGALAPPSSTKEPHHAS